MNDALFSRAATAHREGALQEAEAGYRSVLARDAKHSGAMTNLGRLARQRGDLKGAIALYEQAAATQDAPPEVHFNLGCALWEDADRVDNLDRIVACFDRAIAGRRTFRESWLRRVQAVEQRDGPEAGFLARRAAAEAFPEDAALALEAGKAACALGRPEEATPFLTRAAQDPGLRTEAEIRLASARMDLGDGESCVKLLAGVAERAGNSASAQMNLGVAYRNTSHYLKAAACFRRAAEIDPTEALAATELAVCLLNSGQAAEAFAIFQDVLFKGMPKEAVSAALMAMLYDASRSPADIAQSHAAAMQKYARPPAHAKTRKAGPLRVGFLSGDFMGVHPVAQFVQPLLDRLSGHGIEATVYLTADRRDQTQQRLRDTTRTRSVKGLDDVEAARLIAADAPDVLVDLSGQTSNNRPGIIALRPAPVQACFVGYPSTTGHPGIDVLVADPVLIPSGQEDLYSETVAHLPNAFLCFEPPEGMPEPVFPAPNDRVRLGSLNHLPKLNADVIALWARCLAAAPETDLVLKCGAFTEAETRKLIRDRFVAQGLDPDRLILEGPEAFGEAMQAYHRIDIALDAFPYGGGTTTCQALWMGTPVVTLLGDRFAGRMGASLLTAAGRPEWIAPDRDSYIDIVAKLAGDPALLRQTRARLARAVRSTPLCDMECYTADVAALLHDIAGVPCLMPPDIAPQAQDLTVGSQDGFESDGGRMTEETTTSRIRTSEMTYSQSPEATEPRLDITTSRQFSAFLSDTGASLAISTYQAGMVLFVGTDPATGKLWMLNRHIGRPMGIACDGGRLAVAAQSQVITFVDGHHGTASEGQDPVYVPQLAHYTGDLDVHDIAFDANGDIVFVNTLFSCLANVSPTHSFRALWKPRFISRLAAEDRCHLNGLAMREGVPAFVTAVSTSDVADGWRDNRGDGGVVVDVASGEIVANGLSMPHSPRWHDGRLWMLSAGTGEIGTVDPQRGEFIAVAFCPGYLRGLSFFGRYALVGASEPRGNHTFGGLALQERLDREKMRPRCGVFVIDTVTGDVVHWLRLSGVVSELFDIAVIPRARQPQMIGFRSDQIRRVISMDDSAMQTALA